MESDIDRMQNVVDKILVYMNRNQYAEIQRFVDKIIKDAKENVSHIVEEAHKSAEAILEQQKELARQKASGEVSAILKKAENDVEAITLSEASEARRKANWLILSAKEHLVTDVLDEVKNRLAAFTRTKKYAPFLQRAIVDAGITLGGGNVEVLLNKRDSDLPLNFTALAKAITEKTGIKTELKLSKEGIDASGGAVIKRIDGKILVDNTFEAIIKRSEGQLRLKIAKILFK